MTLPRSPGRDGNVGIATGCGLDGLRFEYRLGRDFPHDLMGVFPWIKAAGAWH
jgi:hypothetical protein